MQTLVCGDERWNGPPLRLPRWALRDVRRCDWLPPAGASAAISAAAVAAAGAERRRRV